MSPADTLSQTLAHHVGGGHARGRSPYASGRAAPPHRGPVRRWRPAPRRRRTTTAARIRVRRRWRPRAPGRARRAAGTPRPAAAPGWPSTERTVSTASNDSARRGGAAHEHLVGLHAPPGSRRPYAPPARAGRRRGPARPGWPRAPSSVRPDHVGGEQRAGAAEGLLGGLGGQVDGPLLHRPVGEHHDEERMQRRQGPPVGPSGWWPSRARGPTTTAA